MAVKLLVDWDTCETSEGPGQAQGWMAEWQLPVDKSTVISLADTRKPRMFSSDVDGNGAQPSVDSVISFVQDNIFKFEKAANALEVDLEGFGQDGSRNRQIKEKQTHGFATFSLKKEFTHSSSLPVKRGFVRMQELGVN